MMTLHALRCFVALATLTMATCDRGRKMLRGSIIQADGETAYMPSSSESCADLLNKNTHFSVAVSLGTPPQTFDVVADTGSDSLIVTSCVCVDQGFCAKTDKCYRGTNHSSTFSVASLPVASNHSLGGSNQSGPLGIRMTFGSGSVTSIIATDVAQVGGLKAKMDNAVLLMIDRRELQIAGEFQGILGLGPPTSTAPPKLIGAGKHPMPMFSQGRNDAQDQPGSMVSHGTPPGGMPYKQKLFMQQAGVKRFSLCFNDANKPGSLRMNVPEFKNALPAVGTAHWGLGLYGLSVGKQDAPVFACEESKMKKGQQTPCGAIPDSGTTLMMGPKDQVEGLFENVCKDWKRCREARKGPMKNLTGSHAFQTLLHDCNSWKTKEQGINEVPSVFLTVGKGDSAQKLELTAWSYIIETMEQEYTEQVKHLFGIIPVILRKPTGKMKKVCIPSFGAHKYDTNANGPVWILGTPLFYQYTVGYGMTPAVMAFTKGKCGSCNETKASLLTSSANLHASEIEQAPAMRQMSGAPRVRALDTSLPL